MLGLLQIFYSPAQVFDRVRERGMWLPAFLAIVLCVGGINYFALHTIGVENVLRKGMESNARRAEQMGPEGIARAASNPMIQNFTYAAPVVVTPIIILIIATLFLTGLSMTGSKVRLSQALGATSYAWFPYSLISLMMSVLIIQFSPNKEDLNLQNLIATNAGAFLDPTTTNKALYSFATSMDLLSFGLIAFLAYGLSRVSGRAYGSCLTIVGVLWLLYVVGKTGIAAI